ncbi:MAG: STAS domain-containing protein [bacterium]|nr:STAS domain-containing protein [bacterium]
MSITIREEGGVSILAIVGELTESAAVEMRALVARAFEADGRDFVVDLAETTRIDSAGLEALTWLKRECDERLGLIKLCNLTDALKKILEMTRLEHQFEQYEFVEDALESYA